MKKRPAVYCSVCGLLNLASWDVIELLQNWNSLSVPPFPQQSPERSLGTSCFLVPAKRMIGESIGRAFLYQQMALMSLAFLSLEPGSLSPDAHESKAVWLKYIREVPVVTSLKISLTFIAPLFQAVLSSFNSSLQLPCEISKAKSVFTPAP